MTKNAFESAVKKLKASGKSVRALREALLSKGFGPEEVEAAVSRCVNLGYLDDRALAESTARKLLEDHRSLGELERKLVQMGIDEVTVAKVLTWARAECGYDELASARHWLERRGVEGLPAARFLASRGFTVETLERLGLANE